MNDFANEWIEKEYERIKAKLEGGMLFGEPIDPDNSKHLIVVAYGLGRKEESDTAYEELMNTIDLFRRRKK